MHSPSHVECEWIGVVAAVLIRVMKLRGALARVSEWARHDGMLKISGKSWLCLLVITRKVGLWWLELCITIVMLAGAYWSEVLLFVVWLIRRVGNLVLRLVRGLRWLILPMESRRFAETITISIWLVRWLVRQRVVALAMKCMWWECIVTARGTASHEIRLGIFLVAELK